MRPALLSTCTCKSRHFQGKRIMLPLSLQYTMATKWDHATLNSLSPSQAPTVLFPKTDGDLPVGMPKHTSLILQTNIMPCIQAKDITIHLYLIHIYNIKYILLKQGCEVCSCKTYHYHKLLLKHPSFYSASWEIPSVSPEQRCLNMTKKLAAEIKLDRKAGKVFIA